MVGQLEDLKDINIKRLRFSAEQIYKEDVEVLYLEDEECIQTTIHFPEIIITNSKFEKHTIKDLWFRFYIACTEDVNCDNFIRFKGFKGLRSTFDIKELINGYAHSHLNSEPTDHFRGNWYTWCLGTAHIKLFNYKEFSYEAYDLILLLIKEYVKWESLEGGPYTKIKQFNPYIYPDSNYIKEKFISKEHAQQVCLDFIKSLTDQEIELLNFDVTSDFRGTYFNEDLFKTYLDNNLKEEYFSIQKNNSNIKFTREFNYNLLGTVRCTTNFLIYYRPNENKYLFSFKDKDIYSKIIYEDENIAEDEIKVKTLPENNYQILKTQLSNILKGWIIEISNKHTFLVPNLKNLKKIK